MALTEQQIRDLIADNVPDNNQQLITPAKMREVLSELLNKLVAEGLLAINPLQPLSFTPATKELAMPRASSSQSGYLHKDDFAALAAGGGGGGGSLPSQTGQNGKYLRTDGTLATWQELALNAVLRTGTSVTFDKPAIYNTINTPGTGAITYSLTGAVPGTEVAIYHTAATQPTLPSGTTLISGAYKTGAVNIIRLTYLASGQIAAVILSTALGATPPTPTLQEVVSAGDTTTLKIRAVGIGILDDGNTLIAQILAPGITGNRTLRMPDKDGVIATLDDIVAGASGEKGWSPVIALVADGSRIVMEVVGWVGGAGVKPTTNMYISATGLTFTIADAINVRGPIGATGATGENGREIELQQSVTHLQWRYVGDATWNNLVALSAITGANGTNGTNGNNGWSPVLAVVTDGTRRVFQVTDWQGGQGTKPTTGLYVGASGFVSDIASAVDVRGATGATGGTGAAGRGFNPRGAWAPSTAYAVDDIVTLNGNTYRRTVAGTSGATFNAANWELWAAKGDTGAAGAAGADMATVAFSASVQFNENRSSQTTVTGAIAFSLAGGVTHVAGRRNVIYVTANGVNKPTFSSVFKIVRDDYVNTNGVVNRIFMEYLPNGNVLTEIIYIP